MSILESVRSAWHSLRANRMRSVLTMLGVIIGVGAVIALQSLGRGAQNAINSQIESMGTNLLFIQPGSTSQEGVRSAVGSAATLTLDDALAIADSANCPSVAAVAPEVDAFAQVVARGQNINVRVTGTTPDYEPVRNSPVESGDFVQQNQVDGVSAVAVLGSQAALDLFSGDDPIGQTVYVNRVPFRVIGVMRSKGGGGFQSPDSSVIVPITSALSRLTGARFSRGGRTVSSINVQVVDKKLMDQATQEIAALLRERHRVVYEDDFQIQSQQDIVQSATQITGIMTLFLSAIAGISLLVGGIGIMNIMLVSVTERTREIGIRKSIGAKSRDIMWQFLIEAIVLSEIGGVIGILLGLGIGKLVEVVSPVPAAVTVWTVFVGLIFCSTVGLIFGVYPASKAARMNPIVALRHE
jgi:putative ABC transport system permease protein